MRVVITGAGSGFGAALARRLLARGDVVVALDAEAQGLAALAAAGASTTRADVRDAAAIQAWAADVMAAGPVDALVNDAGYAVFGAQDEADLDAVQAMFDTNVFGLARVTRALLPALRAARGVVVQLSSVAGRMVFPESGYYAASKHAVEALSEGLFVENVTAGLRVAVVEPGAFSTGFSDRAMRHSQPRPAGSCHADVHALWDARRQEVLEASQDPGLVVDAILTALDNAVPFQRLRVGADAQRVLALRDALGEDGWVAFMGSRYGGAPGGAIVPGDPVGRDAAGPLAALARATRQGGHLPDGGGGDA